MVLLEHKERLIKMTGEHWIKYVLPSVIAVALSCVSIVLFVIAGTTVTHDTRVSEFCFASGLVLLLFTHHWFFVLLLSEGLDSIIVTNRRLIFTHCRLLLDEDFLEVSFDKMKTVEAHKKGILQNLLHYGTVIFETNKASIDLVPNPNHMAELIQRVMSEE